MCFPIEKPIIPGKYWGGYGKRKFGDLLFEGDWGEGEFGGFWGLVGQFL
ncbi:MAG: hypothetical protein LBU34_17480 [Planctomycetaceae bacterium]|nr:hypothetical protein [Planctomycetaceae bacterium]